MTLAVVLQVRAGALQALLWQRGREPYRGAWSLPGGELEADETLEASIRRHLAAKVDVREVSHLEQLATYGDPERVSGERELATAYLAQEDELVASVAQIIDDVARGSSLSFRMPSVETARLLMTVWEGASVRAAMAGLDYQEMCARSNQELARVAQLIVESR